MDDRDIGRVIGFFSGLLVGLVLLLVLLKLTKKDGMFKCRYDERQQLVQGRGFKYGFKSCIGFNILYICLYIGFGKTFTDTPLALFIGILIGSVIYASYCIWNEGYFSLNEYPGRVAWVFAVLAFINFVPAVSILHGGDELLYDGKLPFLPWANLFCVGACIFILCVMLAKRYCDRRKTE